MQWTEAQAHTIESRGKNILVSAAAGSGKTAVLIERIKQLILQDKVDVDRFLITTFTNAASQEMRERLEKAIRKEMDQPDADRAFLKRQLDLMYKANIGTFHNFALEVMHRYFYLTELEPGFIIGDEIQVSILKKESVDALFETRFEEDFDRFKAFLRKYSGDRNENRLKDNMISLYDELRSVPDYFRWARESAEWLRSDNVLSMTGIAMFLIQAFYDGLGKARRYFVEAADLLADNSVWSLAEKAREDVDRLDSLEEIMSLEPEPGVSRWDELDLLFRAGELMGDLKFNTMRAAKDEKDDYEAVKETVSVLRKKGKKEIDDLKKKYFSRSRTEAETELKSLSGDTAYLVELLEEFEQIFREKKKEKNMVDFDDVMHYASKILDDPMAAEEYREKFTYIFIDEFQDSNMLQEIIAGKICRENNLFMVGDVKQSIYKFRLAEPEIFRSKYELYKKEEETQSEKIDLNSNFRSKKNVTRTVNTVFEKVMEDYDEDARLHCTAPEEYPGYPTRVTIIDRSDEAELEDGDMLETTDREIATIARIVSENKGQPVFDVKKQVERSVEYRDIVILSRNRHTIPAIEKALNDQGIPAFGENPGGYFESVEIEIFVNLLKVIDNIRQDIPLISVMHSPIFDFTAKELAKIRIAFREGSFYQAIRSYAETPVEVPLQEKVRKMLEQLTYWKQLRRTVSLEELLRVLLYETGYYDYCSGLPVGKQRISNLRMLVEKAAAFEESNYTGLYGFLSYIDAMKKNNLSMGEAKTIGENEDVVRIMTVHKSKGLEFPVVILAGAGRTIRFRGSGSSMEMHKDCGIGLPLVNREEGWHKKTLLQRVIEGKKAAEELEEEVRILYVALTRAIDRLEIVGTVKDLDSLDEEQSGKRSFLDMVYAPLKLTGEEICVEHLASEEGADELQEAGIRRRHSAKDLMQQLQRTAQRAAAYQLTAEEQSRMEQINAGLSYQYPYSDAVKVKSKYSVTELAGGSTVSSDEILLQKPEFTREHEGLTAAQRGSAMHLVMEHLDFAKALEHGGSYIRETVEKLRSTGALSEQEAKAIRIDQIQGFFAAPTGRRAAQARTLQKEREFILQKDVSGTQAIVQGIIDCFFEEEDGMVIIDYKNSYVGSEAEEEELRQRYGEQLTLYKEALEASCGRPVKETWLYLFYLKKFIRTDEKF